MDIVTFNWIIGGTVTLGVVILGAITIWFEYVLLRNSNAAADEILRVFVVTLIIVFGLVLVSVKDAEGLTAASPLFGLFGTVVGYLLGAGTAARRTAGQPAPPHSN